MESAESKRQRMVEEQLQARGIKDPRVLDAMRKVPREKFVLPQYAPYAYEDSALPIEEGQTISQPYIVAFMTEQLELKGNEKVLEIGTGSGYAAAILSQIVPHVYTIERIPRLAQGAQEKFSLLGYSNISVKTYDGTLGWEEHGPYDAIVITAGGPSIPQSLLQQLAIGGRLIMPLGSDPTLQELIRITKTGEEQYSQESRGSVRFVPLIGKEGWQL